MTTTQRRILIWLPATVSIVNELVRTYVRPVYGRARYGLLSTVLGWLPNLLASFGFMALGLALALLLETQGQTLTRQQRWLGLGAFTLVSLVGFLGHEFTQGNTGLHYDINDVWATLVGTLLGAVLCWQVLLRPAG